MANVSSLGVGSGLDLNSLLDKLMAVERQPINQLQSRQSNLRSQVSALGQIKSALSSLQTAADNIKTPAKFASYSASAADTTLMSVSAGAGAVGGSYQIEVQSLAANQKLLSGGFASASSSIASGTLSIEMGTLSAGAFTADSARSFNVTINSSNNTLSGLRDAINAAGAGVTATLINDGSSTPVRLVLSSTEGGTKNVARLSGLAGFDYNPAGAGSGSLTQKTAASDAVLKIDDITITKSSNVITDAIEGVTLNLKKSNLGSTTTVNVSRDAAATAAKVQSFVDAYNALNSKLRSVSNYDSTTKTGAALSGDYSVRNVQDRMRNTVTGAVAGSPGGYGRLSEIGITLQVDGSLAVDSTKLNKALNDPTKDVSKLFAGSSANGIAASVSSLVTQLNGSDGIITARTEGLNKTISGIDTQIASLNDRMGTIEARYRRQFTALDNTISQLNQTSSYLTQQLAKL